jgi:hypothetical protein
MFFLTGDIKGVRSINNFREKYQAYSFAVSDKDNFENTGKIILCQKALQYVQHLINERDPLIFELAPEKDQTKKIHAGVIEFSAFDGQILMPFWVYCIFILL